MIDIQQFTVYYTTSASASDCAVLHLRVCYNVTCLHFQNARVFMQADISSLQLDWTKASVIHGTMGSYQGPRSRIIQPSNCINRSSVFEPPMYCWIRKIHPNPLCLVGHMHRRSRKSRNLSPDHLYRPPWLLQSDENIAGLQNCSSFTYARCECLYHLHTENRN